MVRRDESDFQTRSATRIPPTIAPSSTAGGSGNCLNSMASPRSTGNRTANSSESSSTVGRFIPYYDQGSPWSSNTSVRTRDVPFTATESELPLYLDSAEEASVHYHDVEGVYSISFTNYPAALRRALEKNPSFRRCEFESHSAGREIDAPRGTDIMCYADQLQAIIAGLKNCRHNNHIIATETYRYWIFELLRQSRLFQVGLNEAFLFSVPQSDLTRVQIAGEGQRHK